MREAAAKVALLEARLGEVALQRSQLEELVRSVARSRDENLVGDIEAAVRAAVQQSALTGSAEPLVATLKQSDERLARANQPRLEPIRRAIARDLDRAKAVERRRHRDARRSRSTKWCAWSTSCRCSRPRSRAATALRRTGRRRRRRRRRPAAAAAPEDLGDRVSRELGRASRCFADNIWAEIRSLVRVTPIDHPEAMLVAPEQAFFLRENLKLRLLNARLALLAASSTPPRPTCRCAQAAIDRYFDRGSKRDAGSPAELMRQVARSRRSRRRRAAARRHARRARRGRRPGARPRCAGARHARNDLVRAAVRRGGGGRVHLRHQRRPRFASTGAAGGSTSR